MKYSANPRQPIVLTQEDSIALVEVIKTIDMYLQNRDIDQLVKKLSDIDFILRH